MRILTKKKQEELAEMILATAGRICGIFVIIGDDEKLGNEIDFFTAQIFALFNGNDKKTVEWTKRLQDAVQEMEKRADYFDEEAKKNDE